MKPLFKDKREIASLIPYRVIEGGYEFFLQKRDTSARSNRGLFGLFGGGLENEETLQEGLLREITEELSYAPLHPIYLSRYETNTSVLHIFIEEVPADFESKVVVGEGEYGKFLKVDEVLFARDVSLLAQTIIHHLIRDVLEKK